jgi:four helix bundle protein
MMSNVAEGFERGRLGEFHQFLSTAKASCAELRSQLYVALDVGYLDDRSFQDLRLQAEGRQNYWWITSFDSKTKKNK